MGDQECLTLTENAVNTRILTINGQTIMVNGTALKLDTVSGADLFSVLQSTETGAEDAIEVQPSPQLSSRDQLDEEGGFLLYFDNDQSAELQSMQITPDQAAALGLDTPAPVLEEPPPLTINTTALDKDIKPPVTFSIRLQTNTVPKVRPPPLQIVSGPIIPPPGKVAIPRPTDEARIIRTNPCGLLRTQKVIPRILATPTASLPPTPPLVPFSKSVLKVSHAQEAQKLITTANPLKNASKPLGSSENPIQLVQHGQTYHSVQPLNQEQLKQISTVLQQKQIETTRNTKNVLFDESTNTKIIYRVVCPDNQEQKKTEPKPPPRKRGRPSKAKKMSDDEDYIESDISKGEKEERKKHIPRTRSGRLSRPPRHMVKDYKRIHHLDFAEPDLDDSDGGYSDYQISDSEVNPAETFLAEDQSSATANETQRTPKLINSRFRCPTCHKIYLGYKRLAQHFTQFSDHGSIDALPPQLPPAKENNKLKVQKKKKIKKQLATAETKNKIKKFLANCEASEVAEIAGNAVVQSMELWDLLLLKTSVERGDKTRTETLLKLLNELLEKAKETVSDVLIPPINSSTEETIKITIGDSLASAALVIPPGSFNILKTEDDKLNWIPPAPEMVEEMITSPEAELQPDMLQPSEPCIISPHSDSLQTSNPLAKAIQKPDTIPPSPEKLEPFGLPENALESGNACALNSTIESEKPSDTSLLSDTPLDEIVSAELNNLVSKSGISDFVTPPEPSTVAAHIFTDQNFHPDVDMELSEVKQDLMDHSGFESMSNHHSELVGAPHEVDFEALSEEFNRNTQA